MGANSLTCELNQETLPSITPERIERAVYRLGGKAVEVCVLPRGGGMTNYEKPNAYGVWLGDPEDPEKPAEGVAEPFKHSVELEIDLGAGTENFFVFPYKDSSDHTIKLGAKPLTRPNL